MKAAFDTSPLTIPPALLAEIRAAANEEHRPADDVLRDIIERGLEDRRWRAQAERELQRASALGLPDTTQPTDSGPTLREKIAAGMASLRAGQGTDGDAFMAHMDAELAELERQGH